MKKASIILILVTICIGLLQFIGPEEPEYQPVNDLTGIPQEVNAIIRSSCFDCHSTQTELRWYDKLTPANYIVSNHIAKGREALDFSTWDSLAPADQNTKLYYSLNKILQGEMPLFSYTAIHPNAKLSTDDIMTLKNFLITRTPRKPIDSIQIHESNQQFSDFVDGKMALSKQSVQPAPNGIDYIPDYRNWKVISISDRFDNGTMRIIYGNDIAVKAIQNHATNPWPDGAIFAKTAWKQQANADGSITAGSFVQVEFMIKDTHKYAATNDWGWARWRGTDLKPYGGKALFTAECIACHQPMKNNDYVFTKPLYLKDYQQKTNKK
ncbi:cytochrome P460 family protein [Parapedobacter koreensis]|uniref:Haem-binding domain-containing protein n=1 Tax=Parapedobacter koreensis TaxID=332977 RepID=A0A1H7JZ66_9SPHI|nr:cytochrome P460 family protein [Parapedobacter koreensis]SEK79664.1 Haem-binding domain-containing protein [Parapedobacter koreensis]